MSRTSTPKHVASLDFDNCLFQVTQTNKRPKRGEGDLKVALFQKELQDKGVLDIYVGTSRQSTHIELLNISRGNGASYQRFEAFAGEKFVLHKGLTADAWTNKSFGYTFDKTKALVRQLDAELVCNAFDDDDALDKVDAAKDASPVIPGFSTKIDILYMQMQDAYRRANGEPVVFHFYDDSERILDALHAFYSNHPDMIPANMTLALHKVEGDAITLHKDMIKSGRQSQFLFSEVEIAACTRAGLAKAVVSLRENDNSFEESQGYLASMDKREGFSDKAVQAFKNGVLGAEQKLARRFSWLLHSKNKAFIPLVAVSTPVLAAAATFTALAAPSMVLASNPLMITAAVVAGLALVSLTVFSSFLGQANHVSKYNLTEQLGASKEAKQDSEPSQANAGNQ